MYSEMLENDIVNILDGTDESKASMPSIAK